MQGKGQPQHLGGLACKEEGKHNIWEAQPARKRAAQSLGALVCWEKEFPSIGLVECRIATVFGVATVSLQSVERAVLRAWRETVKASSGNQQAEKGFDLRKG